MRTRFILIETSHAGNVGAVARAMKVMGFDDLVLVAPRWPDVRQREEAIERASGADDVLAKARQVATLDEALDGMDHLCATAMTPRDFGPPTRSPRAHFEALLARGSGAVPVAAGAGASLPQTADVIGPGDGASVDHASGHGAPGEGAAPDGVAFLFGSERYGMRNEDVYRCHVALSIPTDPAYGSLNLAAAVQLIAYEWRQTLGAFPVHEAGRQMPRADARQLAGMLSHWEAALVDIGFLDPAAPKKLMPRLTQLFNRAHPTEDEIHILRGIAKAMQAPRKHAPSPAPPSPEGASNPATPPHGG